MNEHLLECLDHQPMNFGRQSSQFTSKLVGTYNKLFQGLSPQQIAPNDTPEKFFSDLLDLDVKREYLQGELIRTTKNACLGGLKVRCGSYFLVRNIIPRDHPVAFLECTVPGMHSSWA